MDTPSSRASVQAILNDEPPPRVLSRVTFHGNGNAWSIMAKVREGLKKAGATEEERDEFTRRATSGDYDNLLREAMRHTAPDVLREMIELMEMQENYEQRLTELEGEADGDT